jgi:lipoprotein-releasing system permease protein
MNFSLFVAKRYFFAKQSKSIIQIITWIAVFGLAISTAAMVIVLSAFNGIESIVHKLYSDFDPEITIEAKNSKTFDASFFPWDKLEKQSDIHSYFKIIEEVVVIKKLDKIAYATLVGAEDSFFSAIQLNRHIDQGEATRTLESTEAVMGLGLMNKLDFYVFEGNPERIQIYAPVRDAKIGPTQTPFKYQAFFVVSGMNYNKEVNTQNILVDFSAAQKLLNYNNDLTRIGIQLKNSKQLEKVKRDLQDQLGEDYSVKTNLEKNELIFKTSKVEKIIVLFILVFIFILSSFNMVASLTMMFIEKRKDMRTLSAIGLSEKGIFSIFFKLGLIINFIGILLGLIFGYAIVSAQKYGEILKMPNAFGDAFPVEMQTFDFLLILVLTALVGFVSAYLPVRYLVKKYAALR